MKQTQRFLQALLLAAMMILIMIPAAASAEEADDDSGTIKTVIIDPPGNLKALPDELQQVEYIQSTLQGKQWIDLGFAPKDYTDQLKSEIDLQYTDFPAGSTQALSGVGNSSSYYWIYGINTSKQFVTQSGGNKTETVWGPADKERHIFMVDQAVSATALDYNSQKMTMNTLSSVDANTALFKGAAGNTVFYTAVKLYSARFSCWDADTEQYKLIRYMVPCYVKEGKTMVNVNDKSCSGGTAGLYELVEGKFYTNAGDGTDFEKGKDVSPEFKEIEESLSVTLTRDTVFYDGTEQKPDVTVEYGDVSLQKDFDYTVTYKNNIDIGTGEVEVQMSPEYGSIYIRMTFSVTISKEINKNIYYQEKTGSEDAGDVSRLYTYIKGSELYMFLPASANYNKLKLHLPDGAVLTGTESEKSIKVGDENNGSLDVTKLFGSDMKPGTEYRMKVTFPAGGTYTVVLIRSADIPSLYITMDKLENSKTKEKVTEGDSSVWLEDYINQSKDWSATGGSVLMVDADGETAADAGLSTLKGRGNGSWTYGGSKKPYNIKLESKEELITNAGSAKKWCLVSNYMTLASHDSTGLANSAAYWLYSKIKGDAGVQYQQVDLYVNGVYRGTYSLTERVEINKNRVNITESEYKNEEGISTRVTDANDPAIKTGIQEYYYSEGTELAEPDSGGGFLLEVNSYYDEVCKFKTRKGVTFTLKEPEYATKEQVQQIAIYVQEFEDALFSDTGYNSQGRHYSDYVNLNSLAKKLIVDAFMGNGDSMKNSGYFHIDAVTAGDGDALKVNFKGKMLAGPAWDYDFWSSFTDLNNLWTNNSCHGKVWLDELLKKGDFMDILYQLNETYFKSCLAEGSVMISELAEKLTPSKTMEDVLLNNNFTGKSTTAINNYNKRLEAWNSTVWNSNRLMGVTVGCSAGQLTASVNGKAASYQWYKLSKDTETGAITAEEIPGAVGNFYTPDKAGEYQVAVTGTSMEPALGSEITMYSAPFTVGDGESGSYTLTLDTCGGAMPDDAGTTVDVTPGGYYPDLPRPVKEGCHFMGWFTRAQGGDEIISGEQVPAYGADGIIYAQWKTTKTVQDVDDVTGAAFTSDGSAAWENSSEKTALTGLILYGSGTAGTKPSAELTVSRLPAGYQEVEYIASTEGGQQWIDLGFAPNYYSDRLKSEIDLQYTVLPAVNAQSLGGASSGSSYYLIYGATANAFKMQSGGNGQEVTWSAPDLGRHIFILDQQNKTATLDGISSSKKLDGSAGGIVTNVALFRLNGSSNTYYSVMKLYSAKFYYYDANKGDYTLFRDLVPCYETASGKAGLYDMEGNKFYYNANSGSAGDFGYGEKVYITGNEPVTVTSPVELFAWGDVRDSYNAVTGAVTRRVKVEEGAAVGALPETEWTTEYYKADTEPELFQYKGINCAAYMDSSGAPITVVYEPATVELEEEEFICDGKEHMPGVKVIINGEPLDSEYYTVTWPEDVITAGKKEVTVTIDSPDYNGILNRTYIISEGEHSPIHTPTSPSEPDAPGTNPFEDVDSDAYYYDAVMWAVENGITEGTSAATFSPNTGCTRAEIVTFLWRAAGCPEPENREHSFTDAEPGAFYYKAMLWAVETGVTEGTSDNLFSPDVICSRAQTVTFLWRFLNRPASDTPNPFGDVAEDTYYTEAVLWAAENGITEGTSDTTFSPYDDCTRAQNVTFLYRCLVR